MNSGALARWTRLRLAERGTSGNSSRAVDRFRKLEHYRYGPRLVPAIA